MIEVGARVYVSSVGEHGIVRQIIKTGIPHVVKYRVTFADDRYRGGIYGAAFVQPAGERGRSVPHLRLAAVNGVVMA